MVATARGAVRKPVAQKEIENPKQDEAATVPPVQKGLTLEASANSSATAGKAAFEIDDDVPMPIITKTKGAKRGSKYPFDILEPNKSFHIPKTADNPNPAQAIASSLTGARKRFAKPLTDESGRPMMETVKVKNYKLDARGKRVKDANGKFIVEGEINAQRQKFTQERDFVAVEVGTNDPRGPGVRIFRTK